MKVLVVDIGGTYIKYAVINESLEFMEKSKVETPKDSYDHLLDVLNNLYLSFKDKYQLEGISIAVPGIVDAKEGFISMGGALRYNDGKYLGPDLEKLTGAKVLLENDAKAAAMAEASFGALKDVDDGFVLLFGTMIGGGYIKDKKLVKGKHFSAGEVSYLITDRDSNPNPDAIWGNRCGINSLYKYYSELSGENIENISGESFFDSLEKGNKNADLALRKYAKEIAVQIFNIETLLDPEIFALGGGIAQRKELLAYIDDELEKLYASCIYNVPKAKICLCKFIADANLIGAYSCFKAKFV